MWWDVYVFGNFNLRFWYLLQSKCFDKWYKIQNLLFGATHILHKESNKGKKRGKKARGPKAHATRAFQGFRIIRALLELRLKSVILTIFSVNF